MFVAFGPTAFEEFEILPEASTRGLSPLALWDCKGSDRLRLAGAMASFSPRV